MLVREAILPQKVPVVGDKQEAPRAAMDFWIGGISAEPVLTFLLTNLAEPRHVGQLFGHVSLDVVVEQDERRLLRLSILALRHSWAAVSASGHVEGTDRSRSYPCP